MEVVRGTQEHPLEADALVRALDTLNLTGTLYFGFPVLRSLKGGTIVDALLVTKDVGVVAMAFMGLAPAGVDQDDLRRVDDLYIAVERQLKAHPGLIEGRKLVVDVEAIGLLPPGQSAAGDTLYSIDDVPSFLSSRPELDDEHFAMVNEALEGMATIRPAARRKGAGAPLSTTMRSIDQHIANLDWYQKRAAIEFPSGPQRIRGLAGSGKTVVLAMKTAYLHGSHPDWDIAVTFQSRALHQQLRDMIRGFYIALFGAEPDFDRVRVMHAWGSSRQPGFYSEVAGTHNLPARDFNYGKNMFGRNSAFGGICAELLEAAKSDGLAQMYDVVLIDEAQDFPQEFFELAYMVTKAPHRVVFAYDELQNLSNQTMKPVSELFGNGDDGLPRVPDLASRPDEPARDIVLPVCYRNTPWALTIAHALGFGVYREDGLIQFFDSPDLWDSVGYEVVGGSLEPGKRVRLRRKADSYPAYFAELMKPDDSLTCHVHENRTIQAEWLAQRIQEDLDHGGLDLRDILVILTDPISSKDDATAVLRALADRDIPAHVAGVTSSVDMLFAEDSVAITGIYRAKGNEAAMVYILDADFCFEGVELIRRRNILFTAITRSRGWVRVSGCGDSMAGLVAEVQAVLDHTYELDFDVPTAIELERLRRIHRDLTDAERGKAKKVETTLADYLAAVDAGDLDPENLPRDLREKLRALFGGE